MNRRTFIGALCSAVPAVAVMARAVPILHSTFYLTFRSQAARSYPEFVIRTHTNGRVTVTLDGKRLPVTEREYGWLTFGRVDNGCRVRADSPHEVTVDWIASTRVDQRLSLIAPERLCNG